MRKNKLHNASEKKIKRFLSEKYSNTDIQTFLDYRFKKREERLKTVSKNLKQWGKLLLSAILIAFAFNLRHEWIKSNLVETSDKYYYGIGLPIAYYAIFSGLLIFSTILMTSGITGLFRK